MTSDVISLDAHRPQFCVVGGSDDGASINEYRFTHQVAEDIALGKLPIDTLPTAAWQTIMRQWMEGAKIRQIFPD